MSLPLWHICIPAVASRVSAVLPISDARRDCELSARRCTQTCKTIARGQADACGDRRGYHGNGELQPGQLAGREENLPIALGIWFQLKWKSEVLEWIIGVEPLNGQTFL